MSKPMPDHSQEFEDLFREHYLLVYRTACVITGSPEDAEGVLTRPQAKPKPNDSVTKRRK
jgi:hypothetical protein